MPIKSDFPHIRHDTDTNIRIECVNASVNKQMVVRSQKRKDNNRFFFIVR